MPRKKSSLSAESSLSGGTSTLLHNTDSVDQSVESAKNKNDNEVLETEGEKSQTSTTVAKKRGRRPKGGKIIVSDKPIDAPVVTMQENIILHLRCSLDDIKENGLTDNSINFKYNPEIENVEAYSAPHLFTSNTQSIHLNYHELSQNDKNSTKKDTNTNSQYLYDQEDFSANFVNNGASVDDKESYFMEHETQSELSMDNKVGGCEVVVNDSRLKDRMESSVSYEKYMNMINTKLHHLSKELHTDDIKHKRSACFWCTYDFDSEVIHIPKYNMNSRYHVYGCFCSPQCATAYLMNERVDSSIKFERYQLINNIYGRVYNYNKNIKPAPNPYYMLDKFYGSLDIQEFRDLLMTNRSLVVIDKPMTHVFPELYEDNEDFIVSKRTIPKNNSVYTVRKSTSASSKK